MVGNMTIFVGIAYQVIVIVPIVITITHIRVLNPSYSFILVKAVHCDLVAGRDVLGDSCSQVGRIITKSL